MKPSATSTALVGIAAGLVFGALLAAAGADGRAGASPGRSGLIAFVSGRSVDKASEIYAIRVDGAAPTNLTRDARRDFEPASSPDGTKIAFAREQGHFELYVMEADGSSPRHVARGHWPAWSPDGRRIAYVRGGELRVLDASGSNDALVASGDAFDSAPAWSPDGTRIAIFRAAGRMRELVVAATDGRAAAVLHSHERFIDSLPFAWTVDGGEVLFRFGAALRAARADGGAVRTVYAAPGPIHALASAPDGRIAIVASRNGGYGVYTLAPSGGEPTLVDAAASPIFSSIGWSSDGRLAYLRGPEIAVVVPPNGPRRFTPGAAAKISELRWLGGRLLYAATVDRGNEIYTAEVGSGSVKQLTDNSWDDVAPAWSADGSLLAFASNRDGDFEIYVMPVAGGTPRQITRNRASDSNPTWSPDGTRLVFDGRGGLVVANSDGSGRTRLLTRGGRWRGSDPDWSPDGTRVAFIRGHDDIGRLAVIDVGGRRGRFIGTSLDGGSLGQARPDWSPDGTLVAVEDLMDGGCDTYERALTPTPCGGIALFKAAGGIAGGFYNRDRDYDSPAWSPDRTRIAVGGLDSIGRHGGHRVLVRGWDDAHQLDWQPRCSIGGDARAETLRGGVGTDVICAFAGADRIAAGARHDVVYGGPGNDVVDGGTGRDWLFGAAGADRIHARDGQGDIVDCGPGRDSVVVDTVDKVSSDCERIRSRRR